MIVSTRVTAGSPFESLTSGSSYKSILKDPVAVRIERAKVVLFVRIVGVTKVIEHCDGLDDAGDDFGAERGDAGGHHCNPPGKILTQVIVQRAAARSLAVHD